VALNKGRLSAILFIFISAAHNPAHVTNFLYSLFFGKTSCPMIKFAAGRYYAQYYKHGHHDDDENVE
jgi:hypothetical protein